MADRLHPARPAIHATDPSRLVSVVIPTRNRPDQAVAAAASCLAQQWDRLEVLLFDDDPRGDAARMVKAALPSKRLRVFTTDESRGSVANRNRGFAASCGEIVFSLDDDAYFTDPDTVARTVAVFDSDPTIGAVALPYIEPLELRSESSRRTPFRSRPGDELQTYVGCAAAFRRDVLLALGGYRHFLVHYVEERDLSMRLWANGWRIVCGDGGPVVHKVDRRRDNPGVLYYACRNQLLNEVLNTPSPDLFVRIPWLAVALLRYRFSWASLPTRMRGLAAGLAEGVARRRLRRPMRLPLYRRWRALPGHGPSEFAGALPPPCAMPQAAPVPFAAGASAEGALGC